MASRIIETYEIGTDITRLIRGSNTRVRLVSPYLNLKSWKHLEDAIVDAGQRQVDVQLLYRRDQREIYKPTIETFIRAGVKAFDWERLHAKLYLGDNACIITSMNLDGSSAANSEEFAMLSDEPVVVGEISKYIDRLFGNRSQADEIKLTAPSVNQAVEKAAVKTPVLAAAAPRH
jgi:phosphatidylserine/phosphatidylglycerophosphate/cardiolipin synthase-like enzyme